MQSLNSSMQNLIDIANILREHRKSVKITIDTTGKLVVFAPVKMSIERLSEILNQKSKWIEKKLAQVRQVNIDHKTILNFKQISVCGTLYDILASDTKTITVKDKQVLIPQKYYVEGVYIKKLLKWQRTLANEVLNKRTEVLSKEHRVEYKSLKIGDFRAKWGSCDSNKNIKLNWRLIMLPHNVIDYVILHELSHTFEMNHSQRFYDVLGRFMPDWKQARLTLKRNNFLLGIYR